MLKSGKIAKGFIFVFLGITIVFPIISLFFNIDPSDFKMIVNSAQFKPMVFNSVFTSLVAGVSSVLIALGLAWAINRSNIRYKSVFAVLFTLPMLIPSVSHGIGLVILLGDNGLITNLLNVNINLYGYTGIIIGSILYSFPVAFLLLNDIFHYEDFTAYESAKVLGLSKFQQLKTLTIPNMKGTLISTFFAVFTMIFTDYGVPLIVGGKMMTLSVFMYREVIGLLNFSKGAIIGAILLIPAIIAFLIDLKSNDSANESTVTKPYVIDKNKTRDFISYSFILLILFLISLPLVTFMFLSFVKQYPSDMTFVLDNVRKAFNLGVGKYLLNSLTIALLTALLGVCVSYFTAYLTARSKKSFSNLTLHLISMISLAIPGVVLGLSYVMFFGGSVIYRTLFILVLVNVIHFFASPYLLAYNSLKKFNANLEDISETLGIGKMKMLFEVYVPCTQETIIEMFSYMFVNAMVTISAVSFLADFRSMPLSLLIPQFDSQSMIEVTALISVIILFVNILVKISVYLAKRFVIAE